MEDKDKARLVGATVFALLAVILLPWLFGSPVDPRSGIQSRFEVDGQPEVVSLSTPPPVVDPVSARWPPAATLPSAASSPQPTPAQGESRPAATSVPIQPAAATGERWVLQLVSVSSPESAQKFADQLRALGHVPVVDEARAGQGTVWRVRLILQGSESRARAVQTELDRRFKIKSVLRRG